MCLMGRFITLWGVQHCFADIQILEIIIYYEKSTTQYIQFCHSHIV